MERTRHHSVRLTTDQAFDVVSMWRAERNFNAKYRNWANTLIFVYVGSAFIPGSILKGHATGITVALKHSPNSQTSCSY